MTQLEIVITNGWLAFIVVGITLAFIFIYNSVKTKTNLIAEKKAADLKVTYQKWALEELEKFKQVEITEIKRQADQHANKNASILLQQWKMENESKIREDAINRSYSVNLGKISEHLLPFHVNFPYNPQDARFIGSPIDMILFDGHTEKKDELKVYFLEIKTGKSRLTDGQKKIKDAILNKRVEWQEINPAMLNLESSLNKLRLPASEGNVSADSPTIEEDIASLKCTTEILINDGAEDFRELLNSLKNEPAYIRLCKNKNFNIADFEKQLSEIFED
jgi:predicted Holliday junction resolvase-like endonuclease